MQTALDNSTGFMFKTLSKPGIEGNIPNLMKKIYEKPTGNVMLKENSQTLPTPRHVCCHHSYSTCNGIPACYVRKERGIKRCARAPGWLSR